ncbi:MAG: 3-phosphoshikimate 1-carboxyvinyltransferase [Actinomycetia bacterium]|nr:3-phosphoshikimate 1-carboxyvinyltransferase [Actinomycetes bacterium]
MSAEVTAPSGGLAGTVAAIPSKSAAHRALICAALSEGPSRVVCAGASDDIRVTAACLRDLGAVITELADGFEVAGGRSAGVADLRVGESGTTLRLLLPVVAALGREARFHRAGRLPQRPLSPLYEELVAHGCVLGEACVEPLTLSGRLGPGVFCLDGGVSSQFFSGLLLAFPLLEGASELRVTGTLESRPYVELTLAAMRASGIEVDFDGTVFSCAAPQTYRAPRELEVEGDWSNAAFWLCAGALGERSVTVTGLDPASVQGDRAVIDILRGFGASVEVEGEAVGGAVTVTVRGGTLRGMRVDARDIPDLVPILSLVAAAAEGTTTITGAARLRLKESDRLAAVADVLGALGARIEVCDDGLTIEGGRRLVGATVDAWGDHRIAMMAAIATTVCDGPVVITGAAAVNKSYPRFFEDFEALGGTVGGEGVARVRERAPKTGEGIGLGGSVDPSPEPPKPSGLPEKGNEER